VTAPKRLSKRAIVAALAFLGFASLVCCGGVLVFVATKDRTSAVDTGKVGLGADGTTQRPKEPERPKEPDGSKPPAKNLSANNLPGGQWIPLTEEENVRWKKVRKKAKDQLDRMVRLTRTSQLEGLPGQFDTPDEAKEKEAEREKLFAKVIRDHRFQYIAYSAKEKAWKSVSYRTKDARYYVSSQLTNSLPKETNEDYPYTICLHDDHEDVANRAPKLASMPDIKCVAVFDLYSGDSPTIVGWYFDDGDTVKETKTAPFPQLLDSLKSFVHGLQTTGE
jgi:hypothetical protein